MAPRKLNLNNYDIVDSAEDATITVILRDRKDGTKQPPMHLKSKKSTKNVMVTPGVDKIAWTPTVTISDKGTPEEYLARVHWWMENAPASVIEDMRRIYSVLHDFDKVLKEWKYWMQNDAAYSTDSLGKYNKRRKSPQGTLRTFLNRALGNQDRYKPNRNGWKR